VDSNRHDPVDDQAARSQKVTFPDRLLHTRGRFPSFGSEPVTEVRYS
jgi:hypothetical protein